MAVPRNRCNETYQRVDGVSSREVGESTFLIDPRHDRIHQLNALGAAAWRQLAAPVSAAELIEAFHIAFPDVPRERIEQDVVALLDELLAADLIAKA